jgi:hypothetical protein
MPAAFNVHDGLVDVVFTWPDNEIVRAQETVGGAAHYLWTKGKGPTIIVDEGEVQKPWEDLSNQEKITMVFRYSTRTIFEMAKTSLVDVDAGAARQAAIDHAEAEYNLIED